MTANPRKTLDQAATKSPLQSTDMLPLLRLGGSALQRYGPDDITAYALASGGFAKPDGSNVPYRQGVANLREFDAFLNGVDDDLPAFTAAVASLPAGGGTVEWSGPMRFNSGYVAPAGRSHVALCPIGGATIYSPTHGFTFFTLPATVGDWQMVRPIFITDTGGGVGECFLVDSASDSFICHTPYAHNIYSGFRLTGTKNFLLGRTYMDVLRAAAGRGVVINLGSNEICEVENLILINATDCLAGIEVNSGSAIKVGGTAAKGGTPLKVNPGSGQVIATLDIDDFNGDTSSGHGAWFTGAGTIQRVRGSMTLSGNAQDGLRIDNAANSARLNLRLQQNTGNGMTLAAVSHNESWFDIAAYGNGVEGFEAAAGATNFSIMGVAGAGDGFSGNGANGGVLGAGCDHFTVDLSGTGNGSALLFNGASTGASKVVRTRT